MGVMMRHDIKENHVTWTQRGLVWRSQKICGGEMIKCEGKKESRHADILKKTKGNRDYGV